MKTPYAMFKQTATLKVPIYARANNLDVQTGTTDSTIRCSIQDSGGANTLQNERMSGQEFCRGAFPPLTGATKDSILVVLTGANTGRKYAFRSPLKASGGEGHIFVASLESIE